MRPVPDGRIRAVNEAPLRCDGDFVLYWMMAFRRPTWNFALQRAVEVANRLDAPLLVVEPLRCDYRWASDRLHRFALDGMLDQAAAFARSRARYVPYVEPRPGQRRGLLGSLARRACCVVTDDSPAFGAPRLLAGPARRLPVRCEAVDANGLLPLRAADRVFGTAASFRRHLQRTLPEHLREAPEPKPLRLLRAPRAGAECELPRRWRATPRSALQPGSPLLARLPLDHEVRPASLRGGFRAAADRLEAFVDGGLDRYEEARRAPEELETSGLSPYLHFGHVSSHQVLARLAERECWGLDDVAPRATGSRAGWWGMSAEAESFLDELVTWRELGFNAAWQRDDFARYAGLPEWARSTLEEHASDVRPHLYRFTQLDGARTHDPIWNAAQRELVHEGRIAGYLRMLWGKKILEWTRSHPLHELAQHTPQAAPGALSRALRRPRRPAAGPRAGRCVPRPRGFGLSRRSGTWDFDAPR
jgi:deoxyribodipyrimidine photo-lyase